MTNKTKQQRRAKAVKRLKQVKSVRTDDFIYALTGRKIMVSWFQMIRILIDLLTDDEPSSMEQGYIVMIELNHHRALYTDRGVVYVYKCRSDAEKAKQEADATGCWDYTYILGVWID